MSGFAINSAGGFRSVDGPEYIAADELFSLDIPPETVQLLDLVALERTWRDGTLSAVMWLRSRHRDQLEIEVETTLTAEQFKELLVYMQALRDWPQSPDFPVIEQRPAAPPWIAGQAQ